jgi:hypothetical protein
MLRGYGTILGVALLVLGAGGLLGLWDITPTEEHLYPDDFLYLFTGFIFAYLGLSPRTNTTDIRAVVVGMGVLYALVGLMLAIGLPLLGLSSGVYGVGYNLGQMAFGLLNLIAGWVLSRQPA